MTSLWHQQLQRISYHREQQLPGGHHCIFTESKHSRNSVWFCSGRIHKTVILESCVSPPLSLHRTHTCAQQGTEQVIGNMLNSRLVLHPMAKVYLLQHIHASFSYRTRSSRSSLNTQEKYSPTSFYKQITLCLHLT